MKTKYLTLILGMLVMLSNGSWAQTIDEIFEEGIRVKKDDTLLLRYNTTDNLLSYQLVKQGNKHKLIKDSTLLLLVDRKKEVSVVLKPLNPLNYSYTADLTYRIDPNYEASLAFLETLSSTLSDVLEMPDPEAMITAEGFDKGDTSIGQDFDSCRGDEIVEGFEQLKILLENDMSDETESLYQYMFAMSFQDSLATVNDLDIIESDMKDIADHFDSIEDQIDQVGKLVDQYNCEKLPVMNFLVKKVSVMQLYNSREVLDEYRKKLVTLKKLQDLLVKAFNKAASGNKGWGIDLADLSSKHDSIAEYTVTIYNSGYELSDSSTVVSVTKKKLLAKTILLKRFSWFIPEFSVGIAYTSFDYNTYGTTSDSTGQQYVGEPTKNQLRNLKAMAMANFVLYIPQSPIRPLYQIAIGINADMPTLLTGFGLRTSFSQKAQFTISGGIAMTWLKELNNLKVGDEVSGTSDIEDDLKFQFSWPPKPYVGIQYNF